MNQAPSPDPDPAEMVRLRADPPAVARLSRPMIAVLGGVLALAVGGALVVALQARTPKPAAPTTEPSAVAPTAAAVTDAPKTYADVPKLGPPLPGDLGRPIVAAQTRGAEVATPAMGSAPQPDAAATQAAQVRRQTLDAARTSGLFLGAVHGAAPATAAGASVGGSPSLDPSLLGLVQPAPATAAPSTASTQDSKAAFLAKPSDPQTTSTYRLSPPASGRLLQAGTSIAAALVTAVQSDLPGPVAAQVTRNVYDSLTGKILLIPQGAKLLGSYDAQVSFGQKRVLLAWDRLLLPDGRSLQLDRLVGADAAGRSGLQDGVDAHWGAMAQAALLSSVLGVGAELGSDDDGDVARALRRGVQDTVNQTGQQLVRRQLDVQPTLTLRAGLPLTILVTRDMVFDLAPSHP